MRQRENRKIKQQSPGDPVVILFNKPFNTLCQFTGEPDDDTLADYITTKSVYPAGRLDKDSEGLLILTNDGKLQNRISHPKHKQEKVYWVQVEGIITTEALKKLQHGVLLKDGTTKPAVARDLNDEEVNSFLWQRNPPVRFRQSIPTSWLELTISEGKNRQVRRMTAAVGFPTLRLIRVAIGPWHLGQLQPGDFSVIEKPVLDAAPAD
jgi:23S rRNA pseudouridine2457 synthase